MDGNLEISIDKLPVKRLESIEENGAERFPTDVGYDEKRVSLIRRIDFAWALEREEDEKKKKQKKSKQSTSATQWPWQGMVENLQLAHQELSVIIDLIQTQLGKYFKQSAKALDEQVARETRFYGALIRLQQNWKVKRQRQAAITPGNEGFTFDLYDNSLYDPSVVRPTSLSIIRIDRDPAGMLAINFPPKSLHSLHFGFLGLRSNAGGKTSIKGRSTPSIECVSKENEKEPLNDNESVKATNLLLREVHQAIFDEQEGAPNVVGLFNGSSKDRCMSNKYDCDLVDLPVLILQQVASQVIRWLHGEALAVGMKASRDFLCLSFELDQGGIVSLVAHVDPEDTEGCISWWMVMEEGFSEERKLYADAGADVSSSEYKKFLGYLTLDVLYSTLMDMVSLCSGGGSHR
ncbi:Mediator of RNA polymerase II transcription subunit 17 [Linum perenne]